MVTAFWSNLRKNGCVTTNMACMVAMNAMAGYGKSVILENHYNLNSLGSILVTPERHIQVREHGEYYEKYGMEYLLKRLYLGEAKEELVRSACVPLLFSNIYYLPQSSIFNKEVFEYEFDLVRKKLFQSLSSFSDTIFVDTESNANLSSNDILSEADLIVVCLDQNPLHLREFFDNYSSIRSKMVFLVGAYRPEANWNARKIMEEFSINKNQIGVIPFHSEMSCAMSEGRLLQFLNQSYNKIPNKSNRYLISELKKSSAMLLDNIQQKKRDFQNPL